MPFVAKSIGGGRVRWNVTWTPPLQKHQLARKGLCQRVQNHNQPRDVDRTCSTRGPNRARFLAVQAAIRAKLQCDKKTLLTEADASNKRNLLLVGGHPDNPVEVCGEGNADAKL